MNLDYGRENKGGSTLTKAGRTASSASLETEATTLSITNSASRFMSGCCAKN